MTTAIIKAKSYEITMSGMKIKKGLDFKDWKNLGSQMHHISSGLIWSIGDWLNYGEAEYGEKYAQGMDETELAYGTLSNYAYVARQIEFSRRRVELSWAHHQVVAAFEPKQQDELLEQAIKEGWSRDVLRLQIAGGDEGGKKEGHSETPGVSSLQHCLKALKYIKDHVFDPHIEEVCEAAIKGYELPLKED